MSLPKCDVPTRAEWKVLRNKNGGKEGLAKVSMGKKLDEFHSAVGTGDLAKIDKAVTSLKTAATSYVAEVKGKHSELASTVSREILGNLTKYVTAIETLAKQANQKINEENLKIDHEFNNVTDMVIKGGSTMEKELAGMNGEFQGTAAHLHNGVSQEEKVEAIKFVKEGAKRLGEITKGTDALDKELMDLVNKYIKDRRDMIDKFNPKLALAKTETKKCREGIKLLNARMQEIAIVLKQG